VIAEPKTLRYRLWHTAGQLVRHGRRLILRLQRTWPWTPELVAAFGRLRALPTRCDHPPELRDANACSRYRFARPCLGGHRPGPEAGQGGHHGKFPRSAQRDALPGGSAPEAAAGGGPALSLVDDRLARLVEDARCWAPRTMPWLPSSPGSSPRIARITTNEYVNWCFRMIVVAGGVS
jgi:hypothetical protein